MTVQTQILSWLLFVSLLITYSNKNWNNLFLGIASRWMRWVVSSLLFASLAIEFQWLGKPFWLVSLTIFLGWFLIETIYNWLIISALSRSPILLFPRFQKNIDGDEWPATKSFIILRDWLCGQGFTKVQSVKAQLHQSVSLRSSIYQNEDRSIRCEIIFLPNRSTRMTVFYTLSTQTKEGALIVTDNIGLPFGGYYPDTWFVERKPLCRSLGRLLNCHRRRLKRDTLNINAWDETEPLEELNRQQRILEKINMQNGFLNQPEYQEEHGRITIEGRYRLWKEIWLLNYFGSTIYST